MICIYIVSISMAIYERYTLNSIYEKAIWQFIKNTKNKIFPIEWIWDQVHIHKKGNRKIEAQISVKEVREVVCM